MISLRLPPTFMPGIPSSHPGMTCPRPIWIANGPRPACRLLSNIFAVVLSQPVYWTLMLSPDWDVAPVPTWRSMYLRPSGSVTTGSPAPALKSSVPGDGLAAAAGTGLSLATGAVLAYGSE